MLREERYTQGTYPPVLLERVEIERLSPVNVRYCRYDGTGNLLEDREALAAETKLIVAEEEEEERRQAKANFHAGVNALPGANPLKAILRNLIRAQRWE